MMAAEKANQMTGDTFLWFPMRVTYGREETIKGYLDADNVRNFLPMRHEVIADKKGRPRKRVTPAVRNMIFIHSTQREITGMKMFKQQYQPLRYITDLTSKRIMTVPDKQMENFIRVASATDDSVSISEWNDDFSKPGVKVQITDGAFKGVVGVIRRIKRNKHVVVELEGIAAAVITFIPSCWLEKLE
jgi:transcription antitermination factor NusG